MKTFKYIIIGDAYPYVFSEASRHDEFVGMNVTSAAMGKLYIDSEGKLQVKTFGRSVSLGIGPKENDANILKRLFIDPVWDE